MDNYHNKPEILERTKKFSIKIIILCNKFPKNPGGYAIAKQLVRSGTSIGANITEAQDAVSRQDFIHKLSISLKEARETLYWIEIIEELKIFPDEEIATVEHDIIEIIKILRTIIVKLKNKEK